MRNIKVAFFCVFALSPVSFCFAQSVKNETITISAYYPSPTGIYRTLRLYPGEKPSPGSPESQPGTMYFDETDNTPYIYSSTGQWEKFGSGNSSVSYAASKVESGHHEIPDVCSSGNLDTSMYEEHDAPQCSALWFKIITFNTTFTAPPKVMVGAELTSAHGMSLGYPYKMSCSGFAGRGYKVFAKNITSTGFELWGGANGQWMRYCEDPHPPDFIKPYMSIKTEWIAVGE